MEKEIRNLKLSIVVCVTLILFGIDAHYMGCFALFYVLVTLVHNEIVKNREDEIEKARRAEATKFK